MYLFIEIYDDNCDAHMNAIINASRLTDVWHSDEQTVVFSLGSDNIVQVRFLKKNHADTFMSMLKEVIRRRLGTGNDVEEQDFSYYDPETGEFVCSIEAIHHPIQIEHADD